MLIGILSDTHGRLDTTRLAIELLQRRKAAYFIHCGDVGSEQVLDLLAGLSAAFVWGNCDHDRHALQRYAQVLGINCLGSLGRLTLDGKILTVLHGDDYRQLNQILAAQDCDFLLTGHTHAKTLTDIGRIRAINPGAIHRAATKTVALLDTATSDVQFLVVE